VDWVPEGHTVNRVYYKEVLTYLREWVRRRRPEMWKNGSWVLHYNNVLAHNALSLKTFDEVQGHCVGTSTLLT